MRAARRRLSSLGVVLVALALLGGLLALSVKGTNDAGRASERPRIDDRAVLAQQLASVAGSGIAGLLQEVRALGATVGAAPASAQAISTFVAQHQEDRVVVVDSRLKVSAAVPQPRLGAWVGDLVDCVVDGSPDRAVSDAMRAAIATGAGTVTPVVAIPGKCDAQAALVVPTSARGAMGVIVPPSAIVTAVRPRMPLPEGFRVFAVDATGQAWTDNGLALAMSRGQRALVRAGGAAKPVAERYGRGEGEAVGAYAPAAFGWGLVVEQDADAFDRPVTKSPAVPLVLVLAGVFAVAFAVVAWFDVRRRRATRRADEHRSAFLAIVGHELRTPLTVIKGYTETLATRWDALSDESRHMLVSNMAPQAQRQARVIEHLLTAASLQAGTLAPLTIEPTDVEGVMAKVADEFRPLAPLHRFVVHAEPGLPLGRVDARVLGQALGELVDNAVRYSPSGGRVALYAKPAGREIEITVDDEGVGLPANIDALFEPFVQGEDVDRRLHDEGGIGVGLYIARALLARMNGTIRAARRHPSGSRLTVTVPVVSPDRSRRPRSRVRAS